MKKTCVLHVDKEGLNTCVKSKRHLAFCLRNGGRNTLLDHTHVLHTCKHTHAHALPLTAYLRARAHAHTHTHIHTNTFV